MGHDVFISYSTKDKPTADAACATLESSGVRCWIAPRDILPGMDWGESIVDGIKRCRLMVLVFSSNANASPQIRREVERAVNKGIPIIPFRIEEVMPTRSLEYFISTPHWMDAMSPPLEKHLKKLSEVVHTLLSKLEDRVTKTAVAGAIPPSPVARAARWIETAVKNRLSKETVIPIPGAAGAPPQEKRRIPLWALILAVGLGLILLAAILPRGGARPPDTTSAVTATEVVVSTPVVPTEAPADFVVRETSDPRRIQVEVVPPAVPGAVARPARVESSFRPPASVRVSEVFEARRGAEFHVSPDDAIVWIDGRRIGKADDWDGVGGGRTYYFQRPGTYYARFALRGYRTAWVRIVVRPGAAEEIIDVDTSLSETR
jgi:TIR domain-containing protein